MDTGEHDSYENWVQVWVQTRTACLLSHNFSVSDLYLYFESHRLRQMRKRPCASFRIWWEGIRTRRRPARAKAGPFVALFFLCFRNLQQQVPWGQYQDHFEQVFPVSLSILIANCEICNSPLCSVADFFYMWSLVDNRGALMAGKSPRSGLSQPLCCRIWKLSESYATLSRTGDKKRDI